jgi:multiple sugar transport system substrate-binding protein
MSAEEVPVPLAVRKRGRRDVLRACVVAPPLLAALGCSAAGGANQGSGQPAAQSGAPIQVSFMRPANQSLTDAYNAQADAFNKQQSKLVARFDTGAGSDYNGWRTKLTTMLASDTAPDCFLMQQVDLPAFASAGTLLTLDPMLSRDRKEVNPDDFFPSHLAGGKWRGKQVGLTPDGCAVLEYYNVTAFSAAGVPLPKPTWTWDDYLDAARRLTKSDGGQVMQAGIGTLPSGNDLLPWLWSNGADILSDDFKQVRITEPVAVDALQFAVDLVAKHGVNTGSPGVALGPNPTVAGKVAMWRANRGNYGNLKDVTTFKFDVVPLARAPKTQQSVTFTTPGNIAIGRNNKQPDAAWTWLKFLTGTDAQIIRSQVQQGGCPSRKSATQDASYKDLTIPPLQSTAANQAFVDVLSNPKAARFIPFYVAMSDAIDIVDQHVQAALKGEQAVPAALAAAKGELDALLQQKPQPQT